MEKLALNGLRPNEYYLNLIQERFFAETHHLLQFQYFCYILSGFENMFCEEFYTIVQDEIDHHCLLGECITRLGGEPSYIYKNKALSGNDFEYFKGIKNILSYSIELKEKSIISYKITLSKVIERELKNILDIILTDEIKHKEILENMLKKYEENS